MNLEEELAELQDSLATIDFQEVIASIAARKDDVRYRLIRVLHPIKIKMDANKNHGRPHVHIDYGKSYHAASYAIDTGERLVGESKYDRKISEWIGRHRPKLLEAWNLMQAGKDASPVVCELRGRQAID